MLDELMAVMDKVGAKDIRFYGNSKAKDKMPPELLDKYEFQVVEGVFPSDDVYVIPVKFLKDKPKRVGF